MSEERPRVEVHGAPTRCPYCHDDVAVASDDWIACAGCLARHHAGCWDENGRCSSCGCADSLARREGGPGGAVRERTGDVELYVEHAGFAASPPKVVEPRARVPRGLFWMGHVWRTLVEPCRRWKILIPFLVPVFALFLLATLLIMLADAAVTLFDRAFYEPSDRARRLP